MYAASQLVVSGVGATILGAAFGFPGGLGAAWRWGRSTFLSLGLFMIFQGWLQFINFDGNWPWDQPVRIDYRPDQAEEARVKAISRTVAITTENVDDERRCLKFNVCVRRFVRTSRPSVPGSPKFETGITASPNIETRCVVWDGILRCNEYVRR